MLTDEERALMLDEIIRPGRSGHNNHMVAEDGDADEPILRALLERKLIYRTPAPFVRGRWLYHVNHAGRQALALP